MLYTTNYSLFLRSWRNNKIINKQCYVDKVTPESKGWPLLCTLLYNVSHHPLTAEFLSYLMQKQQISHSNKCFIWSSSWTSFKHTGLCFLASRTAKYRHGASWILSPQNLNKQVPCDHPAGQLLHKAPLPIISSLHAGAALFYSQKWDLPTFFI